MIAVECKTCRFFDKGGPGIEPATCRRRAPTGSLVSGWPPVEPADWCGEWMVDGDARDAAAMEYLAGRKP